MLWPILYKALLELGPRVGGKLLGERAIESLQGLNLLAHEASREEDLLDV